MSFAGAAWILAWTVVGPPKLPPLPGEQPPEPPPTEATPGKPIPGKPAPTPLAPTVTQVEPTGPAPQKPTVPQAALPTPPPPGLPGVPPPAGPAAVPAPDPGRPEVSEPPPAAGPTTKQPEAAGERSVARGGSAEADPDDEDDRPRLRLPPPRRPPYQGWGLFAGAGVTFSAALAEQIVAHRLIKRRCIEPFAAQAGNDAMTPEQAEQEIRDFASALVSCAPGVLPAVVLRVHSDLGLLATMGLASAGAAMLAQRRAYDDVFADRPAKRMLGLRIAGVGLLGTGVVTWLTTGALSWSMLAKCRDARCATRARLVAFTTRDTGAVLIAAGAGMLTYAIAHGRAHDRFFRDRALSLGAAYLPGGGGLSLSGRF